MYFETVSAHFEVINGVIFISNPQVIEKVEQETLQLPYITDMPRNDFLSIIFSMQLLIQSLESRRLFHSKI